MVRVVRDDLEGNGTVSFRRLNELARTTEGVLSSETTNSAGNRHKVNRNKDKQNEKRRAAQLKKTRTPRNWPIGLGRKSLRISNCYHAARCSKHFS